MQLELEKKEDLIDLEFKKFLNKWDSVYQDDIKKIDIFDYKLTSQWTIEQKQNFVRIFYHLRGHFIDFLWYMGNFAPDDDIKSMVIENIRDEFGNHGLSHEKLYLLFAEGVGVNLANEVVEEKYYLPFSKKYVKSFSQYVRTHDFDTVFAAFSAYERLDNIDYIELLKLAESFGLPRKYLTFFSVHVKVEHYSPLEKRLLKIWESNPKKIYDGFEFIRSHQIEMWKNLSESIFNPIAV